MNRDIKKIYDTIEKLVKSDISSYELEKHTGISGNTIRTLRLPEGHERHRKIENLTLKVVEKLYDFAVKNLTD